MGTELIPLVFTSGWASGVNAYAAVLVLGLADRIFGLTQVPDALARTDVLVVTGIFFLLEMVADKIPYVDSVWDTIHTVVRPAVGATIGYLIGHESSGLAAAVSTATGGVTALLSHGIKAGLRAAVNTSPEPASNIVVSAGEDVTVTGVMVLALAHPWWSAGISLVLLVAGGYLLYRLAGRLRRVKRRYDDWGGRVGLAAPAGRANRSPTNERTRDEQPGGERPVPQPGSRPERDRVFDQEQ